MAAICRLARGIGGLRRAWGSKKSAQRWDAETYLVLRAIVPVQHEASAVEERNLAPVGATRISPRPLGEVSGRDEAATGVDVPRALRGLQLLFRSERLYDQNHPQRLDSLDAAYEELRGIAAQLNGLELRVDRGGIIAPKIGEAHLADLRGEMNALAADLERAGIRTLSFSRRFHVGELDTLSRLMKDTLLKSNETSRKNNWWPAQLVENHVEGISVNTQTDRRVDTVLGSLIAALVAYGGSSPRESSETAIQAPDFDDLAAALRLLARLTPPLESARGLSPEEAARAIHGAMEDASRDTVRMLLTSVSQYSPRGGEGPQPYLLRLSESLIFEFLTAEFANGTLTPALIRPAFQRLGEAIEESGKYSGPQASQQLSAFASSWAQETHREQLVERFWMELPPREKSAVLRGTDVWCVPIVALKHTLSRLADTGADAQRREARNVAVNYARRLSHSDAAARRIVAAGLNELMHIIESLWPNQLPDDLSVGTMKALETETIPETGALLAAFLENLARVAVNRGDYAGFETILVGLERPPQGNENDHLLVALSQRLVAQDRWLLLADAALANRSLDPVLPRLLQRDPERLLDRLTLLLTEPRGAELIPAMA
ncbi:MAG TPA: hypothetical protein VE545_06600, partial [Candidatus Dormibacteraeota bacterium]|nr:hypothetical protein [Candidatus Dormibacteraeota bacterium]